MTSFAKETLPISLEEEMRRSYLDYAMSVIVSRALPDVRDGLKPVHRRLLFAFRFDRRCYAGKSTEHRIEINRDIRDALLCELLQVNFFSVTLKQHFHLR